MAGTLKKPFLPPSFPPLPTLYFLSILRSVSAKFSMKFFKYKPKHFFRPKDRSVVKRSDPSSFGSVSSSSSDCVSVTPTSVLPEISGGVSEASVDPSPNLYLEILQAFKLIDKDNDGIVSRNDLKAFLIQLGPDTPAQEEVDTMLSEVDSDGTGTISLEKLASRIVSTDISHDSTDLQETFDFFDADHDGLISAEELLRVFETIGDEQCTLEDCRRMIAAVDENHDGFVCLKEFSQMMHLQIFGGEDDEI